MAGCMLRGPSVNAANKKQTTPKSNNQVAKIAVPSSVLSNIRISVQPVSPN